MTDPFDDFDDELEQAAEVERQREQKAKADVEAIKAVMATREGRRVVFNTLAECGIHSVSYSVGDALHTTFREGRRSIGVTLLEYVLTHCRADYALMMTEMDEETTIAP